MNYWLLKTEPSTFSFDDLWKSPRKTTGWGGVRNYQARNSLRDEMKKGDLALIYHSNADPSAVVGIAEVVREGHPDPTQFDAKDEDHYDPASSPDAPRWFQVSVKAVRKLSRPVSLEEIKGNEALSGMLLVQRSRLSVQKVEKADFEAIVRLGG
jgi:predicted RNA-binding protein with PUA-like domain